MPFNAIYWLTIAFLIGCCCTLHAKIISDDAEIRDVIVTSSGAILTTGSDGVSRFTGHQLNSLSIQHENSLKERWTTSIAVLNNNNLAIGTFSNGVYITDDKLYVKKHYLPGKQVVSLELVNKYLFTGTTEGLYVLENNTTTHLITNQVIHRIIQTKSHIFIGTDKATYVSYKNNFKEFKVIVEKPTNDLLVTPQGVVLFTTKYTWLVDEYLQKTRLDSNQDSNFYRGAYDAKRQLLWLEAGDSGQIELRTFPDMKSIPHSILRPHTDIHRMTIDDYGNLWVGTSQGLESYPAPVTKHYPQTQFKEAAELYVAGQSLNEIILCSNYSVYRVDVQQSKAPVLFDAVEPFTYSNRIFNCHVQNETLFIASLTGLIAVDLTDDSAQFIQHSDPRLNTKLTAVAKGPDPQSIFVGTQNYGAFILDDQSFKTLNHLGDGALYSMVVLDNGLLIHATADGLAVSNRNGDIKKLIELPIYGSPIVQLVYDGLNTVWAASYGHGVFAVNLLNDSFIQYQKHSDQTTSGLPSNLLNALALDPDNNVIVTTRSGLAILFNGTDQFVPFGDDAYFSQGSLISFGPYFLAGSSSQGLIAFDSTEIKDTTQTLSILFDPFYTPSLHLDSSQPLLIDTSDNQQQPQFFLSNLALSHHALYYRLNTGLTQWTPSTNGRVVLAGLMPGEYELMVRSPDFGLSRIIPLNVSGPLVTSSNLNVYSLCILILVFMVIVKYVYNHHKQLQLLLAQFYLKFVRVKVGLAFIFSKNAEPALTNTIKVLTKISNSHPELSTELRQEIFSAIRALHLARFQFKSIQHIYHPPILKERGVYHALVDYIDDQEVLLSLVDIKVKLEHAADPLDEIQRQIVYDALISLMNYVASHKVRLTLHLNYTDNGLELELDLHQLQWSEFYHQEFKPRLLSITDKWTMNPIRKTLNITIVRSEQHSLVDAKLALDTI